MGLFSLNTVKNTFSGHSNNDGDIVSKAEKLIGTSKVNAIKHKVGEKNFNKATDAVRKKLGNNSHGGQNSGAVGQNNQQVPPTHGGDNNYTTSSYNSAQADNSFNNKESSYGNDNLGSSRNDYNANQHASQGSYGGQGNNQTLGAGQGFNSNENRRGSDTYESSRRDEGGNQNSSYGRQTDSYGHGDVSRAQGQNTESYGSSRNDNNVNARESNSYGHEYSQGTSRQEYGNEASRNDGNKEGSFGQFDNSGPTENRANIGELSYTTNPQGSSRNEDIRDSSIRRD